MAHYKEFTQVKVQEIYCPYCLQEAEFVDSSVVYGKSYGYIYLCTPCNAYVGVHEATNKPLGTLADKATREARKIAHRAFDNIWQRHLMKRKHAYHELAKRMGVREIHIGESDAATCVKITDIAQRMFDDAAAKALAKKEANKARHEAMKEENAKSN